MANALVTALARAIAPASQKGLTSVGTGRGGWWPLIRESFPGAWQKNIEVNQDEVLGFHAVFACVTLIAADISKLQLKLYGFDRGVWTETTNPAFSPVLRKPNPIQNRIQFWQNYFTSKLLHGNVYVLKVRDNRNIVVRMYVLDPTKVQPLISDDGAVYYRLSRDNISSLEDDVIVPAREIIHDRMNCLFHPLVGVSPIFACGLAATQGLNIQKNSTSFFHNNARPAGILTAPGHIDSANATRLKELWEQNYTGSEAAGKVAVLGDNLKFESMTISPVDAQLIDQLKWSATVVCSVFHVPPYKIGVGEMPKYDNIQSLNVEYYTQCLQILIEEAELCLDEGLGLDAAKESGLLGTGFDEEGLMRMDSMSQMEVLKNASGVMKIDEKRRRLNLEPVPGGDDVYLQQQDYSLSALAKRDAQADPFGTSSNSNTSAEPAEEDDDQPVDDQRSAHVLSASTHASRLFSLSDQIHVQQ